MTGYVYTLSDVNNMVVYVGSTVFWKERQCTHKSNAKSQTFIDNLVVPVMEYVDCIEVEDVSNRSPLFQLESYWVEQFRQWGFDLFNYNYKLGKKRKNKKYPIPG